MFSSGLIIEGLFELFLSILNFLSFPFNLLFFLCLFLLIIYFFFVIKLTFYFYKIKNADLLLLCYCLDILLSPSFYAKALYNSPISIFI